MAKESENRMIVVTGPTASGKTRLAALLAHSLGGEIISADSRQVYRDMDIGTGKDLEDYIVDGHKVPFHLIDIVPAGSKYNIFEYRRDFSKAITDITTRQRVPVLCGGSGLYIEAVTKPFSLVEVPVNQALRQSLEGKSINELSALLAGYKNLHNTTDTDTAKRAIRAIEIEEYKTRHPLPDEQFPLPRCLYFGIRYPRETEMARIRERLNQRLQSGMIEEVRNLLESGITASDIAYYGLEYKYICHYIQNQLTWDEMERQLNIAIRQFAKRQMTWFRKMERQGTTIHWINHRMSLREKLAHMQALSNEFLAY